MNVTFNETQTLIDEVIMKTFYYIKKKLFLYGEQTVVELVNIIEEKIEKRNEKFFITPIILASTLREIPVRNISQKTITELIKEDLIERKKWINECDAKKIVNLYEASEDDDFLFELVEPYMI